MWMPDSSGLGMTLPALSCDFQGLSRILWDQDALWEQSTAGVSRGWETRTSLLLSCHVSRTHPAPSLGLGLIIQTLRFLKVYFN